MVAETFTAAAAQVEPVYHDKEGTLEKTCQWIERAGAQDVDVLVFPETYFPGYPYWRGCSISRWSELVVELQKNSLSVGDDALEIIGETIDEANLHVVLGTNELSERPGSETLYNSLFYFDRSGELVRRHRKLMPTHGERAIWGRGDPSTLDTHDTDIGRMGGLICYENHMTLPKGALAAMGEEIHPAVWPGFWEQHGHPGNKTKATDRDAIETCDQYPAMRQYAFETQSFVISSSAYVSDDMLDSVSEEVGLNIAAGGSMLVNPAGIVKAGPVLNEEALLTAEFDRDERRATKAYFDAVGHYTRWDAVNLNVRNTELEPLESDDAHTDHAGPVAPSPAAIEEIATEHELSIETVESVVDSLHSR
ncbi:nitrilase [Natronorubrum sediminis]|uniref:Nitrilase n=1 Tax=Natronorubrum sediminis TaxID=640943 RepID=A0A1H6FPB3_9EURY|nr:carbon-nitrogen hydrolase family protein [Natronorubrum sediminis]SEH11605.1 nitrilase [Natronorubrum sediminis]